MKIVLPLDGTARSRVRPVSKAVFNGSFALEALLVMAQEESFYAGQLVELTQCEGSYASALIRKIQAAGLIEPVPAEPGQARKYFQRCPSPLWALVLEWAKSLLEPPDAEVARLPTRGP